MIFINVTWNLKRFDELTINELWKIYNLRAQVFVVEQNSPYLDVDEEDLSAYHLYALNNRNEIIAYSRFLVIDKNTVTFGRVVTPKSVRGKGLGKELVNKTLDEINSIYPKTNISIEAQYQLIDFYKRFGFVTSGAPFFDAGVKHVRMLKH